MNVFLEWNLFKTKVIAPSRMRFLDLVEFYRIEYSDACGEIFTTILKENTADIADFETYYKPKANVPLELNQQAFASKILLNGKGLFKRVHGVRIMAAVGVNAIEFVIPYNQCKITGVELIGASSCDLVDLEVYDTPTGAISTIPNYKLNQFGFAVNVAKDYYAHRSEFDSDLIKDMKIKVNIDAQAVGYIGLNLILNEVK